MKTSKSKGFTLIELMVVTAIIALLSSVVLASLKSVREKAVLVKAVSEMRSLQTALELYRNQFGQYPGGGPFDDDVGEEESQFGNGGNSFETFVQNYLISNKFLSKIPHSPFFPNNCLRISCYSSGYYMGYLDATSNSGPYYLCGGQKINGYMLYFWANNKKINLPYVQYYDGNPSGLLNFGSQQRDTNPPYLYCITP